MRKKRKFHMPLIDVKLPNLRLTIERLVEKNKKGLFESDTHVTSTTTTTATPSVRSIPLAVGRSLSHQADNMDHRDFRSSCLARTPSGSLFIPSECKVPASPLNCHLSSQLSKAVNESKSNPERCHLSYTSGVPVPVCNNVRRSSPGHYSRFQFRKSFSSRHLEVHGHRLPLPYRSPSFPP
ncbi:uncharacterized protein CEXT_711101 [Caerostris extrusa]|uniref:Uncharacterized protein n=1 Tax=Caerostris extrusa TaxID=172846 RepID=A0AAV4R666_CAEEX|nr:uncharacterized protein CEXT_711101 [Caerostris extrusa]